MENKKQARPPRTVPIKSDAFECRDETAVYWLGEAGVLINSRGTIILIDPVICRIPDSIMPGHGWFSEVNANRFLIDLPIDAPHIERLDAVLYTHSDDDHMGMLTAPMLRSTGCAYHATAETARKLTDLGVPDTRIHVHPKLDHFKVGCVEVVMTIANHPWQSSVPEAFDGWHYTQDDCTGYKLVTPDGVLWVPGDSLLMDEHLQNQDVNLMFIDFSNDPFHFGTENAIRLANALPQTQMVAYHWGTLDMPDFLPQNADPYTARAFIDRPERLHILAAGEKYVL